VLFRSLGLRGGKYVLSARLQLRRGERTYTVTVRHDLALSGVKLPAVIARVEEEQFTEAMYLLEELGKLLDGLFGTFLVALLVEWADVEAELESWMEAA
jgi:hypothetical protein